MDQYISVIWIFCDSALKWDFVRVGSIDFLLILLCLEAIFVFPGRKRCCWGKLTEADRLHA